METIVKIRFYTPAVRNLGYEKDNYTGPLFPYNMLSITRPEDTEEVPINCRKPIKCIETRNLVHKDERQITIDELVSVDQITDTLTGQSHIIVNPTYNYERKEVTFYCKSLNTNQVYLCTIKDVEL